jgi:hypothetical protein
VVLKGWPGRLEGLKFPYNDEVDDGASSVAGEAR